MARAIHSPFVIRLSAGFLASAQVAAGALDEATRLLETIAGIDTDMPTLAERMLWTARAELALARKQPEQALKMIDHLITSAPEFTGKEVDPSSMGTTSTGTRRSTSHQRSGDYLTNWACGQLKRKP